MKPPSRRPQPRKAGQHLAGRLSLRLRFPKQDRALAVSRDTLRTMASTLGLTESATVHLALRLLQNQRFGLTDDESGCGPGSDALDELPRTEIGPLGPGWTSLFPR